MHTWTLRNYDSIHRACTSPSQTKIPTWRKESGHKLSPLIKKLFAIDWCLLGKWKPAFSNGASVGILTTLQGRSHGVLTQYKTTPVWVHSFCLVLVFLVKILLIFFLSICLSVLTFIFCSFFCCFLFSPYFYYYY